MLADRLGSLITEVARRFGAQAEPELTATTDLTLSTPVDAEFRVGTMGLAGTARARR